MTYQRLQDNGAKQDGAYLERGKEHMSGLTTLRQRGRLKIMRTADPFRGATTQKSDVSVGGSSILANMNDDARVHIGAPISEW